MVYSVPLAFCAFSSLAEQRLTPPKGRFCNSPYAHPSSHYQVWTETPTYRDCEGTPASPWCLFLSLSNVWVEPQPPACRWLRLERRVRRVTLVQV